MHERAFTFNLDKLDLTLTLHDQCARDVLLVSFHIWPYTSVQSSYAQACIKFWLLPTLSPPWIWIGRMHNNLFVMSSSKKRNAWVFMSHMKKAKNHKAMYGGMQGPIHLHAWACVKHVRSIIMFVLAFFKIFQFGNVLRHALDNVKHSDFVFIIIKIHRGPIYLIWIFV